ncbi:MAG: GNAT family N-acetyltransferase [Microcoleus vaginatus WJT46-NPBG5]|jgi:amino-acid N-acetyltransferase|nr:GNAT family N-acetyltransferase [Microcoleus vaginatus WJT46-NPBG5]
MNQLSVSLLPGCVFRPAKVEDIWEIRKLVLGAKLEPTQLRWQQFRTIEYQGKIVACGQLRSFLGVQELGSLVVAPAWRGKGLATYLTRHLIEEATQPLYLECMSGLVPFYRRFGFVEVPWKSLPQPLKIKFALGQVASKLLPVRFAVMQYQGISK